MDGPVWAVVVAAGRGTRFGGSKQFALIGQHSVLDLAASAVAHVCDGVVIVLPPEADAEPCLIDGSGFVTACGKETRAGSVRAGLAAVPEECEIIVVHDAARPLASPDLCERVVAAVREGADGAVPALGLTDTVKRVEDRRVVETLDRSALVRVQTPQAFRASVLRRAHAGAPEATDDASLVERCAGHVVVVPGEESNVKITSPSDLELARWWHERPGRQPSHKLDGEQSGKSR